MKKAYEIMMMFAMMGALMPNSYTLHKYTEELTPKELEEIELMRKQKLIERKEKQGLQWFFIDGIGIWALNEKNAIRKINRLKYGLSCTIDI